MLEFFADNSVLIIIGIFVLIQLLRGKKKPAPEGAPKPVTRGEARRQSRLGDMKAALEDAMREADRQFMSGGRSGEEKSPEAPALPAASKTKDDPYAFHSMMNRGEEGRPSAESSTDYDTKSVDYDTASVDYDTTSIDYDVTATDYDTRSDAFAFHSAIEEPPEQKYHLTGFTGFHQAGSLVSDSKAGAAGSAVAVADERSPLLLAMADAAELRRAVLLREILERPLALRGR